MITTLRRLVQIEDDTPLVVTAVGCVRRPAHGNARDEIQAAFMYTREDGRRILAFYPGSTGHENYYLEEVTERLAERKADFTPEQSVFGMTTWENQEWPLCAGSAKYDALTISMGELQDAIRTLSTDLDHRKVPSEEGGSILSYTDLDDIGRRVRIWQDHNFQPDMVEVALALCEEAGEVARAVLKGKHNIRPETRGDLAEELGDVSLIIAALASRAGIDLEGVIAERLERMERLDFTKDPEGGEDAQNG